MAKLITKHRRGTTAEWEVSTLIPEEGELVLEECSNGTVKIKIGNGVGTFKDLNYITSEVETNIESLAARLSSHISFNEGNDLFGEGSVESELLDARIDHEGTTHKNVGDSIRATGTRMSDLESSLADFIDAKAVDGLYYEDNILYLTAKGQVLEDSAVQIIGGSGGNGGGGSSTGQLKIGYITPSPFVVTSQEDAIIRYTFSGEDSSGDIITQATAVWKIDGQAILTETVFNGENSFNITNYLQPRTQKVLLTITDDSGNFISKTWSVQKIDIRIESFFNDRETYPIAPITFEYIPYGAVSKDIHFVLDGKEIGKVTTVDSGNPLKYELPAQSHGAHLLEVYVTAEINGTTVGLDPIKDSQGNIVGYNHTIKVLKDILWYDNTSTIPVIGATCQEFTAKQYDTTPIEYVVYTSSTETPTVIIKVDDEIVATPTLTKPTETYSFNTKDIGVHTIKIICGKTEKIITANILKLETEISPVTIGLAFDFNPVGNNNTNADRIWTDGTTSMQVSDNFDWVNGGYHLDYDASGMPIAGSDHFTIKSGTYVTFDYKLFSNNVKNSGREFKLIFKTTNVANTTSSFLHCIDSTIDTIEGYYFNEDFYEDELHQTIIIPTQGARYRDIITARFYEYKGFKYKEVTNNLSGIRMTPHEAKIFSGIDVLDLAYSEEDIIEFEFNISKSNVDVPMVMGYEDGVSTRPMVYDTTHTFDQSNPQVIKIGSPDCDVHIYRLKVYKESLTDKDILNNFIADARTSEEIISRYTRNQIYDENQKLDPDILSQKCPWLRVYKLSAPYFTNNKSDKVPNTTIQQIYKSGDPVLDNWTCYNAQHSGQGTTSNNYGAAGRNLDFIMNKSGIENVSPYFKLGDNSTAHKITLTRKSVPVNYLNLKLNIASSNNITNALLASRYNEFNPYRRPFIRDEGEDTSFIKDTMEFHNCVIFIQETHPDISTHREFADTDWHFYGIGNIGDSKKTDNTRLTDPNDPYECCVEIMDVELPLSDFPVDTMYNAMEYKVDEKTKEKIYIWAKNENLGILYEKIDDEYVLTKDTEIDLNKTYYVDILEHDDFSEDFTYGWRYLHEGDNEEENAQVFNYCKQKWIELYRFITTSSDEEFKAHLKDYFVVDTALYNYLFTTRYTQVDNRAKNTFWHYGKTKEVDALGNPIRKWDLCWGYDMDTSLGLNNYGKQVYRYGLEDIDVDENGEEIFREKDSTFFCRIRDLFASELQTLFNTLESKNAWHAESLISQADTWQNEFPEELWRIDIERKYIRTYTSSFINGKGEAQFLTNMANGKMKYHRRQWERSQEKYMASKYQSSLAINDSIVLRGVTPPEDTWEQLAVKPYYGLTLLPYDYMYLNVKYGTDNSPIQVRVTDLNKSYDINYRGGADTIQVYSASSIRSLGDLSSCYLSTIDTRNGKRLTELIIGNSDPNYSNSYFTGLTLGSNELLEVLNLENVTGLTQSLNLSALSNLKELYAFGTQTGSVTFANHGKIEIAQIPAVSALIMQNLLYLNTLEVSDYSNLTSLISENCNTVDLISIINNANNLNRVRLTDVRWKFDSSQLLERLSTLKGYAINGDEIDSPIVTGSAHIEASSNSPFTGAQYNTIHTSFPNLALTFNQLKTCIYFKDENDLLVGDIDTVNPIIIYNPEVSGTQVNYNGVDIDPNSENLPQIICYKDSTDQYIFNHNGWTRTKYSLEEDPYAFKNILGDRTVYPRFAPIVREYSVSFYSEDKLIYSESLPYGEKIKYNPAIALANGSTGIWEDGTPKKQGTESPSMYQFTTWQPSDITTVNGDINLYADFTLQMDELVGATLDEFEYIPDHATKSIALTKYIAYAGDEESDNDSMTFIPETYSINGEDYEVKSIAGFSPTLDEVEVNIEYIGLPSTLEIIEPQTFLGCNKLMSIVIGENVTTLGKEAFQDCIALENVEFNAKNIMNSINSTDDSPFDGVYSNKGFHLSIGPEVTKIPSYLFSRRDGTATRRSIQNIEWKLNEDSRTSCTSIEKAAFRGTFLQDINLPEGISTIKDEAFYGNNYYERLSHKFYDDELSAKLPSTLTSIGIDAFSNWTNLKSITLPANVTIGGPFARNCPALEEISIEGNGKYQSAHNSIVNTDTRTVVQGCSKSTLYKAGGQNGVQTLGVGAFCGSSIQIDDLNPSYEDGYLTFLPDSLITIGENVFEQCNGLINIKIPEKVTKIGAQAFKDCNNLETIELNENLVSLGTYAFWGCAIKTINIPSNIKIIPAGAFNRCTNFNMSTLPDHITEIGSSAFKFTGLTDFVVSDNVSKIVSDAFGSCLSLSTFRFGNNATLISNGITNGSVVNISYTLFEGCSNLSVINCPFDEETTLGTQAPWGAPGKVTINYNYNTENAYSVYYENGVKVEGEI